MLKAAFFPTPGRLIDVLLSFLKQLLSPAAARPARVNVEDLPFFDVEQLERNVVDKAEARRTRYLDWPAFVHLETIALCNALR